MFVFLIALVLLVAGIVVARGQKTYGTSLEQYIVYKNPQHSGDVERFTVEYNQQQTKNGYPL
jgi:hypothetical protein